MSASASLPDGVRAGEAAAALRQGIASYEGAWAAWHKAAFEAHFAAVMGCSEECLAPTIFTGDSHLRGKGRRILHDSIRGSVVDEAEQEHLIASVNDYVEACLRRAHRRTCDKIDALIRQYSNDLRGSVGLDSLSNIALAKVTLSEREADRVRAQGELQTLLDSVDAEHQRMNSMALPGMSETRCKVIERYDDQMTYLNERAGELAFCDKAIASVAAEMTDLKVGWTGPAHRVYESEAFSNLSKTRSNCEKDKVHVELVLQSYFDHHSHGASKSESARPEKKPLSLAPNLETAMAGFKQIQLIDQYCMSRGNELWAIIPDLYRIGHDIDPITCMHWRPPKGDSAEPVEIRVPVSEHLRRYRDDQNSAFAQRLLGLCTPGLRSTLIGQHEHGVNKVMFTASPNDGCALYWVMVQLYHPLSRDHRRVLEREIAGYSSKFYTGDPKPHFKELRLKVREALNITARLSYDLCITPLLDALSTRDAQFTVDLKSYRALPADPDDSAFVLDRLIAKALTITEQLDTARKRWDEKSARVAFADDDDVDDLRTDVRELQAKLSHVDPNSYPKHNPKEGCCHAKGCNRKIEGFKKGSNWKLCSTCLLKARSQGGITLVDGSVWGKAKIAKTCKLYRRAGALVAKRKGVAKPEGKALKVEAKRKARAEERRSARAAKVAAKRARESDKQVEGGAGRAQLDEPSDQDEGSMDVGYERMVENLRSQRRDDD